MAWARATNASDQYAAMALCARHEETISALQKEIDTTRNEAALVALRASLAAVVEQRDAAMATVTASAKLDEQDDAIVLAANAPALEEVQNAPKLEDVSA